MKEPKFAYAIHPFDWQHILDQPGGDIFVRKDAYGLSVFIRDGRVYVVTTAVPPMLPPDLGPGLADYEEKLAGIYAPIREALLQSEEM